MEKNIKKNQYNKRKSKKNSNQYIKLLQGLENFQFSDNCLYGCFLSENPCDMVSAPKKYIQKNTVFATDFCLYIYGFTSIFNLCLSNLKKNPRFFFPKKF